MEKLYNFAPPELNAQAILPIALVAITGILALIVEMFAPRRTNNLIVIVSLLGLAVTGGAVFMSLGGPNFETGAQALLIDPMAAALQLTLVLSTALVILFSESYLREKRIPFGEFYPLVLWSCAGAMVMVSTKNLLMMFLGLEILSISLYVMAGMGKTEVRSEESALKYFLLGAFASGFLLYGISFVYGASGSLHLDQVAMAWVRNQGESRSLLIFGLGLMVVGFGFKSSFVPFHQWTPDVYQGAPTNVTAFMATGSKIGALAALWRVLDAYSLAVNVWFTPLAIIAGLTILVGNIAAVIQTDVKRTLGYSSVAHAGYILVAILAHAKAPTKLGSEALVYYLLSYSLMTIGAFAVVSLTAKGGHEETQFSDVKGLWQRSPIAAATLLVCMGSMIGLPITSGFFGKLLIFQDAVKADMLPLAIILAVGSIISVYYYLGLVKSVIVSDDDSSTERAPLTGSVATACVICAAGVLLVGVFFAPIERTLGISRVSTGQVATRGQIEARR